MRNVKMEKEFLVNFKRSSYNGNESKLTYKKPINDWKNHEKTLESLWACIKKPKDTYISMLIDIKKKNLLNPTMTREGCGICTHIFNIFLGIQSSMQPPSLMFDINNFWCCQVAYWPIMRRWYHLSILLLTNFVYK